MMYTNDLGNVSYLFASLKKDLKSDDSLEKEPKKEPKKGFESVCDLLKLRNRVVFTR